ncbi:hypothetical protein [Paraburkholderia silvatlantica]|nr:hypothetical protein [Paraburkholderia silvatlantica]
MRIIIIMFVEFGKQLDGFFVTKPDAWQGFALRQEKSGEGGEPALLKWG